MSFIKGHSAMLEELLLCSFSLYERTQFPLVCAPTVSARVCFSTDWKDTLGCPSEGTSDVSPSLLCCLSLGASVPLVCGSEETEHMHVSR